MLHQSLNIQHIDNFVSSNDREDALAPVVKLIEMLLVLGAIDDLD